MKKVSKFYEIMDNRDPERFKLFNLWVLEFFRRESMREQNLLSDYKLNPILGPSMRQEVSFWNPNRSKHAEVYWLENFVFNKDTSMRNKILNAMVVKFVGMPTLTLVASNTNDYNNIIDFDLYKEKGSYFNEINKNLDTNKHKIHVWGKTQLQTSLQTAARNFVRFEEKDESIQFKLSHMTRWISYLDDIGMSEVVINPNSTLKHVCEWLREHRGIGPYFAYHPPCNFSRCDNLPNIDEDENYCLVGPGAKRGLEYVFPDVNFKNNDIMEEYIVEIKKNQHEFFDFSIFNDADLWYKSNLERNGNLTTFGTEITFCQFNVFLSIANDHKAQQKRILPLTFDSFVDIAEKLETKMNTSTLDNFMI